MAELVLDHLIMKNIFKFYLLIFLLSYDEVTLFIVKIMINTDKCSSQTVFSVLMFWAL